MPGGLSCCAFALSQTAARFFRNQKNSATAVTPETPSHVHSSATRHCVVSNNIFDLLTTILGNVMSASCKMAVVTWLSCLIFVWSNLLLENTVVSRQSISIFDLLKLGVGPSSSHTTGPWRAARQFLEELPLETRSEITQLTVELYGSLAKTGRGHGTDVAVQLGLSGEDPETIDVATIDSRIRRIATEKRIIISGAHEIAFNPAEDIVFHSDQQLPFHPNALRFSVALDDGTTQDALFYSIGGGFIIKDGAIPDQGSAAIPFPIETADELLGHCRDEDCRISQIVRRNEMTWRSEAEVNDCLATIRDAMYASIHRGCQTEGVLPGGLNVQRRAFQLAKNYLGEIPADLQEFIAAVKDSNSDFQTVTDWITCFALAVNEENAAFGRIVTAPTNGAAGVIPAVLMYCDCFCDLPDQFWMDFLLTAGEIGSIFKKGATISAAMGGCQAEIGVSSAMAAAALAECMGATPEQCAEAAEIAMEHHLGMTCDPIGGLVQIPCIERNAMGAIKAITAAQMAVKRDPDESRVSLDAVIRAMWETAQDMNHKYKETADGGLALQIAVNVPEC